MTTVAVAQEGAGEPLQAFVWNSQGLERFSRAKKQSGLSGSSVSSSSYYLRICSSHYPF